MSFIQKFILEYPKLSILFITLVLLTGGFGIAGRHAYISNAQFSEWVNSLILKAPEIIKAYIEAIL